MCNSKYQQQMTPACSTAQPNSSQHLKPIPSNSRYALCLELSAPVSACAYSSLFVFQDLLQLQYDGVAVTQMFDTVKVNVNLLIHFLNKKFYITK